MKACNFIKKGSESGAYLWNLPSFFEEHFWTTASKLYLKRDSNTSACEFCELFKNIFFVEHLQMTGPEIPVKGSLSNKVASLTGWRLLIILEKDSSTGVSL